MIKFSIQYNNKMAEGRLIYYDTGEFDFLENENADILVLLGFDSVTMTAKGVWGLHPNRIWIKKHLRRPDAQKGELCLITDIEPGTNVRLEGIGGTTYYDRQTGWVCIGEPCCRDGKGVEFATNTIAVVKNMELQSLWLKPELVHEE